MPGGAGAVLPGAAGVNDGIPDTAVSGIFDVMPYHITLRQDQLCGLVDRPGRLRTYYTAAARRAFGRIFRRYDQLQSA